MNKKTLTPVALALGLATGYAPIASASNGPHHATKIVTRVDGSNHHHTARAKAKVVRSALRSGLSARVSIDTASGQTVTTTLAPGTNQAGFSTWSGTIEGDKNSQVVAVQNGTTTAMIVKNGSNATQVVSAPGVDPVVTEISANHPGDHDDLPVAHAAMASAPSSMLPLPTASITSTNVVVKVLNAYTTAAVAKAGGIDAMNAIATLDAVMTNNSLAASGSVVRLAVVGNVVASPKSGTSDSSSELSNLEAERVSGDGSYDQIATARSKYSADAVMTYSDNPECGLAYVNKTPNSSYMFGDVSMRCAANGTYSHEFGHLLGATHDAYTTPTSDPAYAHGYVDTAHGLRDIMSYPNACTAAGKFCEALPLYSNPNLRYNGFALGDASSANAVRQFNEWAAVFSALPKSTSTTASPEFSPSYGSSENYSTVQPSVTFSSNVTGVNVETVQLQRSDSSVVPSSLAYERSTHRATIHPYSALPAGTYKIVVQPTGSKYRITDTSARPVVAAISTFSVGISPKVVSSTPYNTQGSVSTTVYPTVTFSKTLDLSSINGDWFKIIDTTTNTRFAWESYSVIAGRTIGFSHSFHPFISGHTYRMELSGWHDAYGNVMTPYSSTFKVK